jgi:hypothetical protein
MCVLDFPFPWKFRAEACTRAYLQSQVTEEQVQRDIIQLLELYEFDVAAIDAGGKRARGRMMGAARAAGVELAGVQNVKTGGAIPPGFADLEATIAPDGQALYIEVKAPAWIDGRGKILRNAGLATPEQLNFLCSKWTRGAIVMVAWSSGEVIDYMGARLGENQRALLGPRKSSRCEKGSRA